jgi:hypothetical protein
LENDSVTMGFPQLADVRDVSGAPVRLSPSY